MALYSLHALAVYASCWRDADMFNWVCHVPFITSTCYCDRRAFVLVFFVFFWFLRSSFRATRSFPQHNYGFCMQKSTEMWAKQIFGDLLNAMPVHGICAAAVFGIQFITCECGICCEAQYDFRRLECGFTTRCCPSHMNLTQCKMETRGRCCRRRCVAPHTRSRWNVSTSDRTCNEWKHRNGKHKNRHVNRSVFFHSFTFNFYLFSCVRARDFYFLHNGPVCACLHRSKQQQFVSATTWQKKAVGFTPFAHSVWCG